MSGINSSKGRVGKAKSTSNSNSNALDQGAFKVHLQNKATGQWFEMEDLRVTDTLPQLIGTAF